MMLFNDKKKSNVINNTSIRCLNILNFEPCHLVDNCIPNKYSIHI